MVKDKLTMNSLEAAELLGVSYPTMLRLLKRPDFPAIRDGGRWLIPRSALEQWLLTAGSRTA